MMNRGLRHEPDAGRPPAQIDVLHVQGAGLGAGVDLGLELVDPPAGESYVLAGPDDQALGTVWTIGLPGGCHGWRR